MTYMLIFKNLGQLKLAVLLLIFVVTITSSCEETAITSTSMITTVYRNSNEIFPNPERGLFSFGNLIDDKYGTEEFFPLTLSYFQKIKSLSMTLVHRYYLISEFRDKPLSQSFLNRLSSDFRVARQAGVKLIPRFTYNYLISAPDAAKSRVLSHIEQLKPILASNYDVIAYMEAGFIGTWGEWHSSSHNLDKNPKDRKDILFKLLYVLPRDRMVALRYAHHKREIFNNGHPLTEKDAFSGTYRARVGAHNDCFLASVDDKGTYNSTNPQRVEAQKIFLSLDNRYVVQGGEVCLPEDGYEYINCPNALDELSRMHWSALSAEPDDGKEILEKWEQQGCMQEIKRRLGYRFRLLQSEIPKSVKQGANFSMQLKIINDGWASPYNPRKLEVILKNTKKQIEYYLPVNKDPRMWMPGRTQAIKIRGRIPQEMPIGTYEVLLNLPDPVSTIYRRPEYSIRLANKNVWKQLTGYNSLLTNVYIKERNKNLFFLDSKTLFRLRSDD